MDGTELAVAGNSHNLKLGEAGLVNGQSFTVDLPGPVYITLRPRRWWHPLYYRATAFLSRLTKRAWCLALIALILAGCGDGSHSGPIVRDHGWEDGVYRVEYDGKVGYITVDDGKFSLGDEPVRASWVETKTRGATKVGGWWYQGDWRGYLVGIRGGYQFRIVHIVVTAQPVKGDG